MPAASILRRWAFDLLIALGFAILFFALWPCERVFDDAGIILKYMDNFAEGHFFAYNAADGPVFGISGFIHGILAGFLAWTHLCSPLNALFASNFIGLVLVSFVLLRIYAHFGLTRLQRVALWGIAVVGSPAFVTCAKQGLETPLHVALVLMTVLAFMKGNSAMVYGLSVLSVISKLDAVPVVGVLCVLTLLRDVANAGWRLPCSLIRTPLLWAVLPSAIWVGIAALLFGSPLPQTAMAKMLYHPHPSGHWFPFIEGLGRLQYIVLCLPIALAMCLWARRRRLVTMESVNTVVCGLCLFVYLALYYFYNPFERMAWYYVLAEILLWLQLGVTLVTVMPRRFLTASAIAAFIGVTVLCLPAVLARVERTVHYVSVVESEREHVGVWIHANSVGDEVLLAGHGHIARASQLYTIDYSGLNSRAATDHGLDIPSLIATFRPEWVVLHGAMPREADPESVYALARSFYNISTIIDAPTWRVYRRVETGMAPEARELLWIALLGAGGSVTNGVLSKAIGNTALVTIPSDRRWQHLTLGVARLDHALEGKAELLGAEGEPLDVVSLRIEPKRVDQPATGLSSELSVPLHANTRSVRLHFPEPVTLVDPMVAGAR